MLETCNCTCWMHTMPAIICSVEHCCSITRSRVIEQQNLPTQHPPRHAHGLGSGSITHDIRTWGEWATCQQTRSTSSYNPQLSSCAQHQGFTSYGAEGQHTCVPTTPRAPEFGKSLVPPQPRTWGEWATCRQTRSTSSYNPQLSSCAQRKRVRRCSVLNDPYSCVSTAQQPWVRFAQFSPHFVLSHLNIFRWV
jgi:hypothetical protein